MAANIVTAVSIFYEEDGLMKAKADLLEICKKNIPDWDIPRIIAHRKGETKRKLDAEDVVKYFTLLDEKKIDNLKFAAADLRRLSLI